MYSKISLTPLKQQASRHENMKQIYAFIKLKKKLETLRD